MGLTQLITPYFAPLDTVDKPRLGQIAWAPVPHLEHHPHVLEAEREDDRSHEKARARWVEVKDTHFKKRQSKGLPILSFHLGETEELLCYKAKRRPVVVVGRAASTYQGLGKAPAHHEEDRIVVAPIYGLRSEDDPNGFGEIVDVRVRHLVYKQYFPIAAWKEKRTDVVGACSVGPGIARFDRLQFLIPSQPGVRLAPVMLAKDPFRIMHYMLWEYLHAQPADELLEIKEVLRTYLPAEAGIK
jgi:hypothetical protein